MVQDLLEKIYLQNSEQFNPKKLIIYSRDEMKQWNLSLQYIQEDSVEFVIGDIRDKEKS